MIPELQVPAQKAALLVKTLGRLIISLSNNRNHTRALSPVPVNGSQDQAFPNAPSAKFRTDTDQTDLPLPRKGIQMA